MLENVYDREVGEHQHIDHIYFFALHIKDEKKMPKLANIWKWVDINQLKHLEPLKINIPHNENELDSKAPPEDVKVLGIKAIEHVKEKSKLYFPL